MLYTCDPTPLHSNHTSTSSLQANKFFSCVFLLFFILLDQFLKIYLSNSNAMNVVHASILYIDLKQM